MHIEKRKVRTNGFDFPLNPLQIISWLVYGYDILVFYFLDLRLIDDMLFFIILTGICYAILAGLVFFFAYLATSIDPTDPTVRA